MLGKKVGIFPDVRLREGKWYGQNFDPGGIDHTSKEWLLKITGGDPVTIGRKYLKAWTGVLPMKVIMLSNQVPNFNDTNLVSRFVKVAFQVSFRGREDINLRSKLEKELPGIANRCLNGYRRLCRRDRFIQPSSGLALERELAERSNAWQAFFNDTCVFDQDGTVTKGWLFGKFQLWCEKKGRSDLMRTVTEPQHLTRVLNKEVEGFSDLKDWRPKADDDGGRKRYFLGVRPRTKADREAETKVDANADAKVVAGAKAAAVAVAGAVAKCPLSPHNVRLIIPFKRRI
jgi:putative DNA primase/helicase